MKTKHTTGLNLAALFLPLLCMAGVGHAGQTVAITYDADNVMHAFGVRDLRQALEATGNQVVGENAGFQNRDYAVRTRDGSPIVPHSARGDARRSYRCGRFR